MRGLSILLVTLAAVATGAAAQPAALQAAIRAGTVGERFDGYLGYSAQAPLEVRRQVANVNIQRRNLYTQLSVRRNVTVNLVGVATGCELLGRLAVGQAYMLKDGIWRRRAAGEAPPHPDYCE